MDQLLAKTNVKLLLVFCLFFGFVTYKIPSYVTISFEEDQRIGLYILAFFAFLTLKMMGEIANARSLVLSGDKILIKNLIMKGNNKEVKLNDLMIVSQKWSLPIYSTLHISASKSGNEKETVAGIEKELESAIAYKKTQEEKNFLLRDADWKKKSLKNINKSFDKWVVNVNIKYARLSDVNNTINLLDPYAQANMKFTKEAK